MKRTLTLALVATTAQTGCVMLDTEIPHVCVQEQGIELEVPMELLTPENMEALGLSGDIPTDLNLAAQELTSDQLSQMPTVALNEVFAPEGLDAIPKALADAGAEGTLRLIDIRIGGQASMFEGIERLSVTLTAGSDGADFAPVELAVCDVEAGCDVSGDVITLVTDTERDLIPLLMAESPELEVELVARPTVASYELDVDVCMGGSASIALTP